MRNARVWRVLLGVDEAVVEKVEFDEDRRAVVGHVHPVRAARGRCGVCQRRCGRYDAGEGRRRWRTLDLGSVPAYIEADAPRVCCPEHGVVVAHVPWARHGAGETIAFDETVAWLATQCSKTAVLRTFAGLSQDQLRPGTRRAVDSTRALHVTLACGKYT